MGISKGLSFLCLVTIFICLLFIKVADADSDHFGIHAVGHAVEPFCPGGYSDRGDHCQHIQKKSSHVEFDEDDDFDDTYKAVVGNDNASFSLSSSESTEAAAELGLEDITPEEEISDNLTVLGH